MNRQIVMGGAIVAMVGSGIFIGGILLDYRYVPIDDVGFSLVLLGFSLALLGMALKEAPSMATGLAQPHQMQADQTSVTHTCPTCGSPITWVSEHQRHYCYQCRRYV